VSAAEAIPPRSAGHAAPAAGKDQHVGPHLGPLTAGDPHVSIRTVVTSSPLAMQPLVGFLTLLIVGILWVLLSVAFGVVQSLETIAASSTFWLPVLIVVAAWWHGWPGSLTKSRPGAGLVNTVIFIVAALVLTGIAQVIVGKADFGAIFHAGGTFPTFPFLIPLAATIFIAMLQLTFVCDRWPFERMKPIPAGLSALVLCWAIGLLVYFTVVNWNFLPAPARAAMGLRNPGGPVNALDFIAWLVCLVPYQIIFFQLFSGWPFREFENKVSRLVTSNVFVIGAGWLTYLFLANVLRWPGPTIVGAVGTVAVGVNFSSMAFEDYPFHHEKPSMARLGLLMNTVGMAFLTYFVLQAIGNALATWTNPPIGLFIGINSLNFIAPVVILVYAIWGRWPLPPPAPPTTDDALVIDEIDQLTKAMSTGTSLDGGAPAAGPAAATGSSAAPSSGRED
jgi:hypothetical protein